MRPDLSCQRLVSLWLMSEFRVKFCLGVLKSHRAGRTPGDSIEGIRSWLSQVINIP